MKYNIYAIGNMRRSPEAEIFLKYSKRIKNIEFFEYVSNFEEKNKKINDESKKLLSMIKNNGKKILLDEKGKILSSFEFSKLISDWRNHGHNIINFLIGGADGVNENIIENVDLTISLSKMTFPHMLARIVLVEQIYRSETIINNHPYHKI